MEEEDHSKPLSGAIVCCTSIAPEKRSELAAFAEQMGAIHKFDLTSDVTHLIVGDIDTPKYKFVARERLDVKCVVPEWLVAVREAWMTESEVDVLALEKQYTVATLAGLNICLTGFVDPDERKDLETKIMGNGGNYMPNLTREEHFLVAKEPSGAKYDFALRWNIKSVGVEWLDQCIERGMVLQHDSFHPSLPHEKRGLGAWIRRTESSSSLNKRPAEEVLHQQRSRKLRRTASAKLESQNSGLWGDIPLQDPTFEQPKASEWDDDVVEIVPKPGASEDEKKPEQDQPQMPTKGLLPLTKKQDQIFLNIIFVLYGFSDQQAGAIEKHVRSRGGALIDFAIFESGALKASMDEMHVLVPHKIALSQLPQSIRDLPKRNVGTEFWVERCMHLKQYEEPSLHPTSRPFVTLPITGFQDHRISITGFKGFELLHVSKTIKALGGSHHQDFSSEVSLLVCNPEGTSVEKLRHAELWSTPAIRVDWLWQCLESGEMADYTPYLMQPTTIPTADEARDNGVTVQRVEPTHGRNITTKKANSSKAREPPRNTTREPLKRQPPSKPYQPDPFPDSAILSQPDDQSTPMPSKKPTPKPSTSSRSSPQPSQSSLPLREITPNSSPPKPLPEKHPSPTPVSSFDPSLSATITSLLAQRKSASASRPASAPTRGRRRRTLLGRAPSNLSCTSQASNGDNPTPHQSGKVNGSSNVVYDADAAEEEERARQAEQLRMTQVGYQDPEQEHWREKIEGSMRAARSGRKNDAGETAAAVNEEDSGTTANGRGKGGAKKSQQQEAEDEAEFAPPKSVRKQYGTRTTPRRAAAAAGQGVRAAFGSVAAVVSGKGRDGGKTAAVTSEGVARRTRGAVNGR